MLVTLCVCVQGLLGSFPLHTLGRLVSPPLSVSLRQVSFQSHSHSQHISVMEAVSCASRQHSERIIGGIMVSSPEPLARHIIRLTPAKWAKWRGNEHKHRSIDITFEQIEHCAQLKSFAFWIGYWLVCKLFWSKSNLSVPGVILL